VTRPRQVERSHQLSEGSPEDRISHEDAFPEGAEEARRPGKEEHIPRAIRLARGTNWSHGCGV